MNVKDRRIHIFLQLFFLLIGIFQLIRLFGFLQSNTFAGSLFEFQQNELPFLSITASVIASFTALISAFS
ncbi:MAG TPA: hypothetical protein DD671_12895, partial [Balneolaceae bacterium]|nr:hypothetical protein [Balneolaceae bacterium]